MAKLKQIAPLKEMKEYLRVDYDDEDKLIRNLMQTATKTCMDVMRTDDISIFAAEANAKTAIMYTVAYLYEHREDADHHGLTLTLRSLLLGSRREGF